MKELTIFDLRMSCYVFIVKMMYSYFECINCKILINNKTDTKDDLTYNSNCWCTKIKIIYYLGGKQTFGANV